MTTLKELLDVLEKEYPNKATALKDLSEIERERYLAKIELIAYIKLLTTPKLKGR